MKSIRLILFLLLPGMAFAIEPGMSKAVVLKELGQPRGIMQMQDKEWLLYPRGKVVLTEGLVESASLISERELRLRRQREAEERERLALIARQRRQERIIQGDIAKSEILSDPDYYYQSTEQRYNTWKSFREQFPETDVNEEWILALESMEKIWEERKLNQQLADLQDRVRMAEQQVQNQQFRRTSYPYPLYVSYPAYSTGGRHQRPCTRTTRDQQHAGTSRIVPVPNSGLAASIRFKAMQPVKMTPVKIRAAAQISL